MARVQPDVVSRLALKQHACERDVDADAARRT